MVLYGHTPTTPHPEWVNYTLCLDTGCVFGGHVTALRYPERASRCRYSRSGTSPDYTMPAHLDRLKQRNLGHKRSLALRQYALGRESLERLARAEPLWRVQEPVFAVLAMESEPVDPRL
jgi:hypothetical protein